MADSKTLYRLRDGAKHLVPVHAGTRALRPLKAGETVELTPAQVINWRDKFEPVDGTPDQAPAPPDQTLDPASDPSDVPGSEGKPDQGTQGTDDSVLVGGTDAGVAGDPSPVVPTDYTAKELIGFVGEDVDPWDAEQLEALAAAEAAGGNRGTVLAAITKRVAQLSE